MNDVTATQIQQQTIRDLAAVIDRVVAERDKLRSRIDNTLHIIDRGYPGQVSKIEVCVHNIPGYQDCLDCYDEALLAALLPTEALGEDNDT